MPDGVKEWGKVGRVCEVSAYARVVVGKVHDSYLYLLLVGVVGVSVVLLGGLFNVLPGVLR